jgi:hypothetical protein
VLPLYIRAVYSEFWAYLEQEKRRFFKEHGDLRRPTLSPLRQMIDLIEEFAGRSFGQGSAMLLCCFKQAVVVALNVTPNRDVGLVPDEMRRDPTRDARRRVEPRRGPAEIGHSRPAAI